MNFLYLFTNPTNPLQDFNTTKPKISNACSLYNSIYHIHQKLARCPLEWDSNIKLFTHANQKQTPFYFSVWNFNFLVVIGVIGLGSCTHVTLNYKSPEISKSLLVMSIGFGSMAILCLGGAWIVTKHVDTIDAGLKAYQSLYIKSYEAQRHMRVTTEKASVIHKHWYWEILSFVLSIIIYFLALCPAVVVPGGIYLQIDPFSFTFRKIISSNLICGTESPDHKCLQICSILILIFRIISSTICVAEACRFLSLYCLIILLALEILHKSAEIVGTMLPSEYFVNRKKIVNQYYQWVKWYTCLVLAPQIINDALSLLVGFLMGMGFVIFVTCNLVTIRCFEILPLIIYWFMPTVSFVCGFFAYFELQLTVEADIYAQKITDQIREKFAHVHRTLMVSLERKIYERKLSNLGRIKIRCGPFYILKRGAETDYYFHVFLRTVDGVLLPIWQ